MKRVSLEELKSKKADVKKLETIKGGVADNCHALEELRNRIYEVTNEVYIARFRHQ